MMRERAMERGKESQRKRDRRRQRQTHKVTRQEIDYQIPQWLIQGSVISEGLSGVIWGPLERAGMTHKATITPKVKTARHRETMLPSTTWFGGYPFFFSYCRAMQGCLSTEARVVGWEGDRLNLQATTPPWLCTTPTAPSAIWASPRCPSHMALPSPKVWLSIHLLKFCVPDPILVAWDTAVNPICKYPCPLLAPRPQLTHTDSLHSTSTDSKELLREQIDKFFLFNWSVS